MADVRSAWRDAGERLSAFGSTVKAHYDDQHGEEAAKTKEEVGDAVSRLTAAVQDAFEAVGAAAKDTAVRDDAKKVGQSLVGALTATFSEVSDDLRRLADQRRPGGSDQGPAEPSPPSPTPSPPSGDDADRPSSGG